jgi:hypothetical protein
MFVAQDIVLDVGYATAGPRLLNLISGCELDDACQAAYDDGLASIVRSGRPGDLPCPSRLVSVQFLEPSERDGGMTTALRWEAAGVTGDPFPVLDADLALSPVGPVMTRLALAGIHRPSAGRPDAGADRVVMHRVAEATVQALLASVAGSLTRRAPAAGPEPVL